MFKKSTAIQNFQAKSASIMSVFTKTVTDLVALNDSINLEKQAELRRIQEAQDNVLQLDTHHQANTKTINKLQEFLN